ncbi:MAG: AMP-binding protein [Neisseria sp.]|nr:AMP-binding protein [Neisseria sp.]
MNTHKLSEFLLPDAARANDLIAISPDWTRADFQRTAWRLAAYLRANNIQTAALWFDDAAWFACAILATWQAGADALLPPNVNADNRTWVGQNADIWLTDNLDFADELAVCVLPRDVEVMPSAVAAPEQAMDVNRCAWLKTSGSTGQAQLVKKTVQQMQDEALALVANMPFAAGKHQAIGSVSVQHLYGFTFRFATALTAGWALVREQKMYPETLLAQTQQATSAVWISSPALLNRVGEQGDWSGLQTRVVGVISAGGAMPENTANWINQHTGGLFEIYGSTETGVIANRQNAAQWQFFAGVQNGENESGALWIESPWSAGKVQTADVIQREHTGFYLLGRQDRIIKFADKRVALNQLEHDLLQHPYIADVHCALHPERKRLAAWLALSADGIAAWREHGRSAMIATLKQHLLQSQDKLALPRFWRFASQLPRNAQAKIAAADFARVFSETSTAPAWQDLGENDGVQLYRGEVPVDLTYFAGHFDHFPLVPGVVELRWVQELASEFAWGKRSMIRVENLKYQQFIRPADVVDVSLQYDENKDKLQFKITCGEYTCASGRIVFTPHSA